VSWKGRNEAEYPGYDKMVASILATTPEKIIAQGGAFVGTPDEVSAQVQQCIDNFGPIEPSMQINFGGSKDDESLRTVELLAAKVFPRFEK
jgi:alkanesulfonate monooxygenase SsuD/methylene tetrahydromethanopterin reductase-like flavin-dependent oxidoreductase (luciferase family)